MTANSGSGFIKRNRPPRVSIAYQDPYDSDKMIELPFVMGVMADLSGNASKVEKKPFAQRDFTNVSMDTLDEYMEKVEPGLVARVPDKLSGEEGKSLGVELHFKSMADFDPASIAEQVPSLKKLLDARKQLANLQRYMNGRSDAQDQLAALLKDPDLMALVDAKRAESAPDDAAEGEEEENKE